jgi:hypothetical protein
MPAAKPHTYAEKITVLKGQNLLNRSAFGAMESLTTALGCRTLTFRRTSWSVTNPTQPKVVDEELVVNTLLEAVQHHRNRFFSRSEDSHALLDGLAKKDRWRKCLASLEGAYNLTLLLVEVADLTTESGLIDGTPLLCAAMTPDTCALLNAWLKPAMPLVHIPSVDELLRHIFGHAWCDIILSGPALKTSDISKLILAQTPPFMPGLVPDGLETPGMALPELGHP